MINRQGATMLPTAFAAVAVVAVVLAIGASRLATIQVDVSR